MNKKKKIILTIVVLLVTITVIGVSYAYWILSFSSVNPNKVATSCLSLSLTNEKNDINLTKVYPISDAEGKKLTPYSFTITNTCDLFLSYTVNLEVLNASTMPYKYIKAMVNNEAITNLNDLEDTTTTLDNTSTSKILAKGTLGTDDSADYNIRLWMDEDVTVNDTDSMSTEFLSKVTISAQRSTYIPSEQGYTTLANAILANEYQTTPEISKQKIASKQTPDFSKTAPLFIWNIQKASTVSQNTAKMPHPDLVSLKGSDDRFKNLTDEYVLLPIGTGYTFDSETGKYAITGIQQLDPLVLDYKTDTKYYFCSAGYNTNSSDVITVYKNTSDCVTIYELTGATYTDVDVTGSGGSTFKSRVYNLSGYSLTQIEQESDKSDKGIYQMEDDDGISYYYRGSVTNNYVKFAGFYWRIIRINGDGSVRLLYAGEKANSSGKDVFNKATIKISNQRNNPAYEGYMYGTTLNESYEKTTANEQDSNIKIVLDSWYKTNILGTNYETVIANAGFCNDRSVVEGDGYSTDITTVYGPYQRNYQTKTPILKCPQTNDLFTLSTSEKGNKALTYPIGMITVDELMLSGFAKGFINKKIYTYNDEVYWTMSPGRFNKNSTGSYGCYVYKSGDVRCENYVDANYGVRAVINIKGDAKMSGGIGTSSSPYEIVID